MPNTQRTNVVFFFRFCYQPQSSLPLFFLVSCRRARAAEKGARRKSIQTGNKEPNSIRNFLYHHPPLGVCNLTNTSEVPRKKGFHAHIYTPPYRWKASPEKNVMWMKQKIFPRHFYPVLQIKFFNPEKRLRMLCCVLCKYAIPKTGSSNKARYTGNKNCCFMIVTESV